MMKKMWKNRSGVSPVIATILMVAITVVLAAVLYVMVMGFGGETSKAPTVTLQKGSNGQIVINVNPITSFESGTLAFSVVAGTNVPFDADATAGDATNGVKFIDAGADEKVTTGDYFTYTGHGTLSVFYVNGDTVQLVTSIAF